MPRNEQAVDPPSSDPVLPLRAGAVGETPVPVPDVATPPRLLWFLQILIGALTIFFLTATLLQLNRLQNRIGDAPVFSLGTAPPPDTGLSSSDRLMYTQWQTLAALERNAIERRYHQVNVLLMSRTWTRYLGFVTGMIMALIGSGFILGKFREASTSLSMESGPVKTALGTSSPGIVLATLGSIVMLATILSHDEIASTDVPQYVNAIYTPTNNRPEMLPGSGAPPSPDSLLKPFSPPNGDSGRRPR
jgi:hypothetical protein